jgi:hypothetical protein
MPQISVAYTVPVQVVVDTDTGEVIRVVVIDEYAHPDRDGYCEDRDTYATPIAADIELAYRITEAPDIDWPRWQMGW